MWRSEEAAATGAVAPANESNNFPPPYFYAIFTPLSVRVSEDLATAYHYFFSALYSNPDVPFPRWQVQHNVDVYGHGQEVRRTKSRVVTQ